MIKAADGFQVWSDYFNRDPKDVFAVQKGIAGLIANNLELKLGVKQNQNGAQSGGLPIVSRGSAVVGPAQ